MKRSYKLTAEIAEVLGWAARIWSSQCPYNLNAFLIQFSTLIIGEYPTYRNTAAGGKYSTSQCITCQPAPTFFSAAIYIFLGCFVRVVGPKSSALSSRSYLWIFTSCDLISMVIQGVGGGVASSDSKKINGNLDHGANIMLAGVAFQLFSITIFVFCVCDVFYRIHRYRLSAPSESIWPWLGALVSTTTCICIRCIYRTIELGQGPGGYLLLHETYLIALDAVMMVLLVAISAIFHPSWLIPAETFIALDDVQLTNSNAGY